MSEYKRLTGKAVKNLKGNNYPQDYYDIYNRLAELEDKIENGTLVEFPRIIHPNYLEWFVQWQHKYGLTGYSGIIDDKKFYTKEEAEKFLEELKKNG